MAVEGTLDLFKLPEILQLISQQRKTGILTVQGQQDIVAISFLNGGIVSADALNQTQDEGLAKVLVAEGLLAPQNLSRAMAEHQSAGGRFLDLLVERRFVDRAQALHGLRVQTQRLLEELLRWDKGDFKFYSGDEVFYEDGFIPISVEELLMQAAEADHAARGFPAVAPATIAPARPAAPPAPAPVAPASPAAPAATGAIPFRQPPGPLPVSTVPSPAPSAAAPRPVPASPAAPAAPTGAVAHGNLKVVRSEPPAAAAKPALPRPLPVPAADTAGGPFRKMTVEQPVGLPLPQRLVPPLLGAGLIALLVATLLSHPVSLLLPFPWQDRERALVTETQRGSLYLKVDRAAKTHFLLEGSFPDRLSRLAALGLLSAQDLRDSRGRPLQYVPAEESYTIQPLGNGRPVPGEGTTEAITGNFLIDPEFLKVAPQTKGQPLVLLD